jgi:tol-pal system protein YbgF
VPKEAAPPTTSQAEIVLWKSIENSTNPKDFQSYLDQYPKGTFVVLARRHLAEAKAQPEQAPPPDVLYNNALRDYKGTASDLAIQEFSDYVRFYPNTDLAGNCYFYLGEIQFRQGNYDQAVQSYNQVLQNFPTGNKAPSAQLKKGFALIELGKKDDGVQELRHLIQRYPHSPEALQARERLGTSNARK